MPKPADLYVGVMDFFSILLPGAALVALLVGSGLVDEVLVLLPLREAVAQYAAFLLAAYAAGHVLFLMGSLLDEVVYRPIRLHFWPNRNGDAYQQAGLLRRAAIGGTDTLPMNTFAWAKSYLMLHWPAAAADVQRYEADSKFFRSMVPLLVVAALLLLAAGDPLLAAVTVAIAIASCGRYAERRYKSTLWAYRHVIVHHAGGVAPADSSRPGDGTQKVADGRP